jgi:MtN3 and saliva related transmembrane protein
LDLTTIIGAAAAVASTTSFAPQALKIIRSRDTSSISTAMYAVTVTAFALWLVYGLKLQSWPLIVTNGICLALAGFILVMKFLPQDKKEDIADRLDPKAGAGTG